MFGPVLTFTGTARPYASVTLSQGGSALGTAVANGYGQWTFAYASGAMYQGYRAVSISLASTASQAACDGLVIVLANGSSIENVVGSNFGDAPTGNALANTLSGFGGGAQTTAKAVRRGTSRAIAVFRDVQPINTQSKTDQSPIKNDAFAYHGGPVFDPTQPTDCNPWA